ncbi:hypothetical protein IWQ60_005407 [Tieghemiomyces parasiticus]|uniref:Uncharacterized protein n=1 Tax=Tieghemiomyces parasiticus TaxID=78921 RepID=A0A9W8DYH7_9FUNG|nr:hypothetical protein IWQ60_005407 [Tieghemiomyces parasiticus]
MDYQLPRQDSTRACQIPGDPAHLLVATTHQLYAYISNQRYWVTLVLPYRFDKRHHILSVNIREVSVPLARRNVSAPPAPSGGVPAVHVPDDEVLRRRLIIALTVMELSDDPHHPEPFFYVHILGARSEDTCLESLLFKCVDDVQVLPLAFCPTYAILDDILGPGGRLTCVVSGAHGETSVFHMNDTYTMVPVQPEGPTQPRYLRPLLDYMSSQQAGFAQWDDEYQRVYAAGGMDENLYVAHATKTHPDDGIDSSGADVPAWQWRTYRIPLLNLVTALSFYPEPLPIAFPAVTDDPPSPQRPLHLVAACANEAAVLFQDVNGATPITTSSTTQLPNPDSTAIPPTAAVVPHPTVLPESHLHDSVTATLVADVDYDGIPEIITATYGQMLLIHERNRDGRWQVKWKKRLPYPIYGIFFWDINLDGADELVVLTMRGIHVLQPNFVYLREVIVARLKQLGRIANQNGEGSNDVENA